MEKLLRNKKIKKFKQDIEPHEILLDSLAQKKEEELGISERKLETPLPEIILRVFWIFFLILIFLLLGKSFQLQILKGETLAQLSEGNKFVIHLIQAERGVIYDNDLTQLVFNEPRFDLICQKGNLPVEEVRKNKILKEVSQILKKNYEELKREINQSEDSQVLIAENLERTTLILLETKINELLGFKIENKTQRKYPEGWFFAHLIGYQKKEGEKTGLEKYYDEVLKAQAGKIQIKRDVHGHFLSKEIIALPQSGKSLVLWLDSALQKKIIQALEKIIKKVGAKGGAAVALNPQNGGILALVSYPFFDPNLFSQGMSEKQWQELINHPSQPLFNRAVAGRYLVGSTIKPLIAVAALEENLIEPEKKIHCQGEIVIPNPWVPETFSIKKDWRAHGWTDLRKAIAESCNVYFYTIGGGYHEQEGLGPTRIKNYLELFGWNEKTGIDLPGESVGFLPDKEWKKRKWGEDWWDGDTYNLSIGQGFLQITPLEVATAFGAIANGGRLYQPQIVKEIIDSSGKKIIEVKQPKIIRQNFINPENLRIVREGMRQAVTGVNSPQASAVLLNSLPLAVAAKTGTAELGKGFYHNWVTVFAPYQNPKIVLTILIEKIKGDQLAALPVAEEVLRWYFLR